MRVMTFALTALHCTGKPAFLTDSGDNTTSGAMGANLSLIHI